MAYLDLMGFPKKADKFISAIKWKHNVCDAVYPKSRRIDLVIKACRKEVGEEGHKEKDMREPFPLEVLKQWMKLPKLSHVRKNRDLALVALGIRCMRRPSELAFLKCRNVKFTDSGGMNLFLEVSKTDQLKEGNGCL